jgi:hypothetical protein
LSPSCRGTGRRRFTGVLHTRHRTQAGAAAVETAILVSAVLVPLLLGVLYYGFFFWKAQAVPTLDPDIDQAGFVGTYCVGALPQLLSRVETAVLVAIENVDEGAGLPIQLSDITATVVSYVPDGLGVDIKVSVTLPALAETLAFLPLPNDGNVVSDAMVRLQNVRISTGSC